MTRSFRGSLPILLVLASCANRNPETPPPVPDTVAPAWQLKSVTSAGSEQGRPSWLAEYRGSASAAAHVSIYGLRTSAEGLDMTQKRRPSANTVTFYTDHYFAVVRWENTEREPLTTLITKLEKALK